VSSKGGIAGEEAEDAEEVTYGLGDMEVAERPSTSSGKQAHSDPGCGRLRQQKESGGSRIGSICLGPEFGCDS
jgi:hypothetical protein